MKTILKPTIISLGALFAALAFFSCTDNGGGTHNMGNPKNQNPMSNSQMHGRN